MIKVLVSFRVECRLSCRRKNFFLHGAERESLAEREPDLSPDGKGNRLAFRGKMIDFREEDVVAETVSREGVDGACPVERDAVLFLREETLAVRLQGRETDLHQKIVVVRMTENGMAICAGRLREDVLFDYKFIGLSHNTLRGAAGGAVLLAELLAAKGYFS